MERGASGIHRREFLSYSICSAGLLVPGVLSAGEATSGKAAPKKTELRIGYCERSDAFAECAAALYTLFSNAGNDHLDYTAIIKMIAAD